FHIDRGLDADDYLFEIDKQKWGEVMGIARFVGLGVLINEGGDDQYHLPGVMRAYALGMTDMPFQNTPYRSVSNGTAYTVAMGMFLDLAGK
ncbi:hypothetical protein, partial [Pseudomonas sp. FW215-T2]|uniref:hypothetical protein n=1 Tax=Pseudomonas sp. FW215-T2 TaxID=2070672 RepID=UPI000CBD8C76